MTTTRIESGGVTYPARDDPADFIFKAMGTSATLSFKKGGMSADIIVFGFVSNSNLIEGRTYRADGGQKLIKDIEIMVLEQDGERLLAMLSMVAGNKTMNLTTSAGGAISFSTKHTSVDESGNQITSMFAFQFPATSRLICHIGGGGSKLAGAFSRKHEGSHQHGRLHPDIVRQAREGTDTSESYFFTSNSVKLTIGF